jgi:hypothetical protein
VLQALGVHVEQVAAQRSMGASKSQLTFGGASEDGAEAAGGDASGDAGADASGGDASGGADLAARTADLRKNALAFMIKR